MDILITEQGVVILGLITFFVTLIFGWDRATTAAHLLAGGGHKGTVVHMFFQLAAYAALFALAFYFRDLVTNNLNEVYGYGVPRV